MHAVEPSFSFVNAETGWISGMSPDAATWVLRTRDGGLHWAAMSDHFIQNMQFLTASVGVGDEFDGEKSLFAKTADGGRTWGTSAVPNIKFIQKVLFNHAGGWLDRWHKRRLR